MQTEFELAIERRWPSIEWVINPGCKGPECEHAHDDEDHQCEPSFSWQKCDGCGSRLGGTRETAYAIHKEAFGPNAKQPDNVHEISICVDCAAYYANGDLPENWRAAP